MKSNITIIFGKRGSGKSTLTKKLALPEPRLIIFDTLGEYDKEGVVITNILDLLYYLKKNHHKKFKIVFCPLDLQINFNYVCEAIYTIGKLTFAIEEVDAFCSPFSTPLEFQKIIRYGRHRDISIIANTRRPVEMSRLLSSQANRIISFVQHEPRDIAYLKSIIGPDADKLKDLKEYSYLEYNNGQIKIHDNEKILKKT